MRRDARCSASHARGFADAKLGEHAGYLVQELRSWLDTTARNPVR